MPQEKRIPRGILVSAFLLGFAMLIPMVSIPPMEHILKEELLLTHTQTGLLYTTPLIMLVALAIPGGLLADRMGIRRAAGIGAIVMVTGCLLRGIATDFPSLLAYTFIYGMGFGLVFPNLPKLVSTWIPREKAGIATGIFTTGMVLGNAVPLAFTMSVIFPITTTFQGTLFIWAIPGVIATIVWWILVKDPPRSSTPNESVTQSTVPLRQILQNKNLWLVAIVLMLNNVFFYTWIGWTPALMMQKGATPDLASFIISVSQWIAIPSVFFAPRLSYKIGKRKPFIWIPSFVLALISLAAIYMTVPVSWGIMTLVGIFHSTRFVTIMALPVEIMPKEAVGRATGLMLCIGYAGGIIGPLIGGYIFDLSGSIDLSLLILIIVSLATGIITFKIPETGSRPEQ
ncbi:CynX/NimT family MFS transporter [Chloroflexota bacterium]